MDEVTIDPDGTDNSDILTIEYPPSDPLLWKRGDDEDDGRGTD